MIAVNPRFLQLYTLLLIIRMLLTLKIYYL